MVNNHLVTGYWGEPHVTSDEDRRINAAAFGKGRFVLPIGKQFLCLLNNTFDTFWEVYLYDGALTDNGAVAIIPRSNARVFKINKADTGMKRNDLIVFEYNKNWSTQIETGIFKVIQGEETSGTPIDPALEQSDLIDQFTTVDQMALWRIPVNGTTIGQPERIAPVVWNNPPMEEVGVEYCTAEYFCGKPVYTKLVKYTANSNIGNASSLYSFSVSFSTPNFENLIRYCGTIEGTGRAIPCFYNQEAGGGYIGVNFMNDQGVAIEMNRVTLSVNTTFAIQVWYTKTTN